VSEPDDVDPYTVERIARWIEACVPTHRGVQAWQLRIMASALRSELWKQQPQIRSDEKVLQARAADKYAAGQPLTDAEHDAYADYLRRVKKSRAALKAREERAISGMLGQLETLANTPPEPEEQ
jgi:hypothetical protein